MGKREQIRATWTKEAIAEAKALVKKLRETVNQTKGSRSK